MMTFEFNTDPKAYIYCQNIIHTMCDLFSISEEEALGRMNRLWRGLSFNDENDLIFHETLDYWAKTIYYGKDSAWWKNPPGLVPLPYP